MKDFFPEGAERGELGGKRTKPGRPGYKLGWQKKRRRRSVPGVPEYTTIPCVQREKMVSARP